MKAHRRTLPLYATRADCLSASRPCLQMTCTHHVVPFLASSNLRKDTPDAVRRALLDADLSGLPTLCTLDAIDKHGAMATTDIAAMLGLTVQRINRIEREAIARFRRAARKMGVEQELLDLLRAEPETIIPSRLASGPVRRSSEKPTQRTASETRTARPRPLVRAPQTEPCAAHPAGCQNVRGHNLATTSAVLRELCMPCRRKVRQILRLRSSPGLSQADAVQLVLRHGPAVIRVLRHRRAAARDLQAPCEIPTVPVAPVLDAPVERVPPARCVAHERGAPCWHTVNPREDHQSGIEGLNGFCTQHRIYARNLLVTRPFCTLPVGVVLRAVAERGTEARELLISATVARP